MSNKHEGCIRGFYQNSRSWYRRPNEAEEIRFGMFGLEGGKTGEICVSWVKVSKTPTARLECYQDTWDALYQFKDLLERMAELDGKMPQPSDFVRILLECGFVDLTQESPPPGFLGNFYVFGQTQ